MLLNNPLEGFGGGRVVPDPFRIDHRDRSLTTDTQAIRLRPVRAGLGLDQAQFLEPSLQVVPGSVRLVLRRALGLGLIGAEKDVAADPADLELVEDLPKRGRQRLRTAHAVSRSLNGRNAKRTCKTIPVVRRGPYRRGNPRRGRPQSGSTRRTTPPVPYTGTLRFLR